MNKGIMALASIAAAIIVIYMEVKCMPAHPTPAEARHFMGVGFFVSLGAIPGLVHFFTWGENNNGRKRSRRG